MKNWTEKEIQFLKNTYPSKGGDYCSRVLRRTKKSIENKASRLNIKRDKVPNIKKLSAIISYYDFINKSDYVNLETYISSQTPILHRHTCGHTWRVSPNNLRKLVSCPKCSNGGFDQTKPAYLYLVHFPQLDLYKFGITANWDKRKYDYGYKPTLLSIKYYLEGREAFIEEQKLKEVLSPFLYNSKELKSGNTETFIWPH